jgi:GWxTD domain-containing protein
MTKEEKDIFNHLPDEASRKEFIAEFWEKRDPDPETEANEFQEEFFRRLEYIDQRFHEGRPGLSTDRGRIYLYLGPPEKVDEFLFHDDPDIRGSIIWWIYYSYELGIEFTDKHGLGEYAITEISGNLFYAMELAKLGAMSAGPGTTRKYLNFKAEFDRAKKEIVLWIPVKALSFEEEQETLRADFEFEFYIYDDQGHKEKFSETRSFIGREEDISGTKEIVFTFPHELKPGKYYLDVIVMGKDGLGKTRKIFEVRA